MKKNLFLLPLFFFLTAPCYASVYEIPGLSDVVNNITDTIAWIIGTILVLLIVSFGIQFILTAENPNERTRLKTRIIWAVVGLFIILTARPLSTWLQSII